MTAAGRSRLLLTLASVLLAGLVVLGGGRAGAQTDTTAPPTSPGATSTVPTAGDEASTRTVNRIVFVLVALALILVGVAIWFWRATKPTPRHLDGLDMMSTRRWRDGAPADRSAMLAPVHLRRGEADDSGLFAEPEPVEVAPAEEEAPKAS